MSTYQSILNKIDDLKRRRDQIQDEYDAEINFLEKQLDGEEPQTIPFAREVMKQVVELLGGEWSVGWDGGGFSSLQQNPVFIHISLNKGDEAIDVRISSPWGRNQTIDGEWGLHPLNSEFQEPIILDSSPEDAARGLALRIKREQDSLLASFKSYVDAYLRVPPWICNLEE